MAACGGDFAHSGHILRVLAAARPLTQPQKEVIRDMKLSAVADVMYVAVRDRPSRRELTSLITSAEFLLSLHTVP